MFFKKKEFYSCPCCGFKTLPERNEYEICPVCFWEDDPYQWQHPDCDAGANNLSLEQARQNYLEFGACERDMLGNVRKPKKKEYST